jgi:hypothetical protein
MEKKHGFFRIRFVKFYLIDRKNLYICTSSDKNDNKEAILVTI